MSNLSGICIYPLGKDTIQLGLGIVYKGHPNVEKTAFYSSIFSLWKCGGQYFLRSDLLDRPIKWKLTANRLKDIMNDVLDIYIKHSYNIGKTASQF